MYKVRLLFEKLEPACYTSHLDLMKALQRSLRRAGLPVRYSEGFNPHIVLSILIPLSTGYRSVCELCDFELTCDDMPPDLVPRLNRVFPLGLRAIHAGPAVRPVSQAAACEYEIRWHGVCCAQQVLTALSDALCVEKRSKRGSKQVDVRSYLKSFDAADREGDTICRCVVQAGEDPLNPAYLTLALTQSAVLPQDVATTYTRCAILDANGKEFF